MPDPATAVRSAVAGVQGGGGRARLRGAEGTAKSPLLITFYRRVYFWLG